MEIADVSWLAGGPVRVCTAADDAEAEAAAARVYVATLRRRVAHEARAAAVLAARIMGGSWVLPVPPVHVEPMVRQG